MTTNELLTCQEVKGLSLQLELVPINGRIVLRTPLDDEKKEPGA